MPAGRGGVGFGQLVVVGGFLAGLSLAVPAVAWFVLRDADELAGPVQPERVEMGDFPGTEAEPTAK